MSLRFDSRPGRVCCCGLLIGLLAACSGPDVDVTSIAEPLFEGTGPHRRSVDTASVETQRYFDQGLASLYAFNHDEAIRSFRQAAELDPRCAMAQWGIAYANGPHINNPAVPPEREAAAYAAAAEAVRLASSLPEGDPNRALAEAVASRYAEPQPADRAVLDESFAAAMADVYRLYMSHNHHMKAYAAMMVGRSEVAMTAIRELVADIPEDWLKANADWADGFVAMPYEVMMRFGRWEEILAEPEPPGYIPLTRSMHFASRAVALAALNRPAQARAEQRAFLEARTHVPEDAIFGNNRAHDILDVADRLVEGEILYREGAKSAGIDALYEAAEREDRLAYDEPPDWIQPVRHALGATLLMEGRSADAEAVYRQDLERLPDNGWSLYGLGRALRLQGKSAEAEPVEAQFAQVWEGADTHLRSSCFCQPGV
jgi:tetratricopeptide (TPR) repeat protein